MKISANKKILRNGFCACLALFLSYCSSIEHKSNRPAWVINPNENCKEGYICAVGEGQSISESFANARGEIAKQFSVNVNTRYTSNLSNNNDDINRFVSNDVNEQTNEILTGVEIEKTYNDNNGNYYSMAVLNKIKLANEIKLEINEIDTEMSTIITKKPLKFHTIKELHSKRKEKNNKHYFLSGKEIKEKITMNDILKAKGEPIYYKLDITDNENFGLKDIVTRQIIENNNKISKNASKTIRGNIKIEKAYLRVSGFEKYEIDIVLKCVEDGKTTGQIHTKIYETGRNKQQVLDKVKSQVIENISGHIDNLLV